VTAFAPRLDVLPSAQRRLWPELAAVPPTFVLYGGTGLALQLGHRSSVDFGFFSSDPLDEAALRAALPWLNRGDVVQRQPDTLSVVAQRGDPIALSFFGGLTLGRVREPRRTEDDVLWVASPLDLFGCKLAVLLKRIEAKDYRDIAALLDAGYPLRAGLAAAMALYGRQFPPMEAAKALAWFEGGDLGTLTERERRILVDAVSGLARIPAALPIIDKRLHVVQQ